MRGRICPGSLLGLAEGGWISLTDTANDKRWAKSVATGAYLTLDHVRVFDRLEDTEARCIEMLEPATYVEVSDLHLPNPNPNPNCLPMSRSQTSV